MRIGVLTGGGDCPGLNAVIRAIVRKGVAEYGHEFIGFRDGWRGPLEGDYRPLGIPEVRGILPRGGTILGSSRTNPFETDDGAERIVANLAAERGVLLSTDGPFHNVIKIKPPLVFSAADADRLVDTVDAVLAEVSGRR